MLTAAIMKGSMKWREKNRFSVALSTENPPHNHITMIEPNFGIADSKFVITVAPQKDICPQGSTYPIKAVAIINRINAIPLNHTDFFMNEENMIPRVMCIYANTKNIEAPLI